MYKEIDDNLRSIYKSLYDIDGVKAPYIESSTIYPSFSNTDLDLNLFNEVLDARYPVVINWPAEDVMKAIGLTNMSAMHGMSQEVIDNADKEAYIPFNSCNIDHGQNNMTIYKVPVDKHPVEETALYHHLSTFVKDICKHSKACNDKQMQNYFDTVFHHVLTSCRRYEAGNFTPHQALEIFKKKKQ